MRKFTKQAFWTGFIISRTQAEMECLLNPKTRYKIHLVRAIQESCFAVGLFGTICLASFSENIILAIKNFFL